MNNLDEPTRRWVLLARILRPRGNKGAVVAELWTDFSSRFSNLKQLYLGQGDHEPEPVALEQFWVDQNHPGRGVFHFSGCATISDAEKLRGREIFLPFKDRIALPAGQYFVTDLIGCQVFDSNDPDRTMGKVSDVFFPGETVRGTPLLQVKTPGGELLLPLAEEICKRIDVAGRRIDVTLPEGLNDVNDSRR